MFIKKGQVRMQHLPAALRLHPLVLAAADLHPPHPPIAVLALACSCTHVLDQ